jgi:glycosyltransferase involved in cell wall biosynthesis
MNLSLASILIPCRNAEQWLATAIESALAQRGVPCEVIVVDDGSTDRSVEVARRYTDAAVQVLTQPAQGAAAARNAALAASKGNWIQFLDADDALAPDKIARQLDVLIRAPANTVASASWGRFASDQSPASAVFADAAVERDFNPAWEFLAHHASTGDMMHPAAWLCPRELLKRAGPWDETLTLNDDGEYFARVLRLATAVRFVPGARTFYRSARPGSLSRARGRAAMVSLHRSVERMAGELLSTGDTPRIRQTLCDFWERTRFELYPEAPDLSDDAAARARRWGRPRVTFACGPRLRWIARIAGWKLARRLQRHRNAP